MCAVNKWKKLLQAHLSLQSERLGVVGGEPKRVGQGVCRRFAVAHSKQRPRQHQLRSRIFGRLLGGDPEVPDTGAKIALAGEQSSEVFARRQMPRIDRERLFKGRRCASDVTRHGARQTCVVTKLDRLRHRRDTRLEDLASAVQFAGIGLVQPQCQVSIRVPQVVH